MRQQSFVPVYVDVMPEEIEAGRLYVSKRFRTAAHLCACGCGDRVVTPLKPAKWQLIENGERVSLTPSIGRWQLPCKSHYWIRDNQVVWSVAFSEEQMQRVLERDTADVRAYYASRRKPRWMPDFAWAIWRRRSEKRPARRWR